jgi:DNA-binding NarL/FixJ family response regulator
MKESRGDNETIMKMTQEQEGNLVSLRRSKVMELLSKGYTNQSEIADTLNVSEPTVS